MKFEIIVDNTTLFNHTVQDASSNGKLYYIDNGTLMSQKFILPAGNWQNVTYEDIHREAVDNNISNLAIDNIPGILTIFVWNDGKTHRIAVIPDEGPLYGPNSLNRFYWGIDTDKLYINVEDTWQYCATTDHTKMNNVGTLTHEELEDEINKLKEMVLKLTQ